MNRFALFEYQKGQFQTGPFLCPFVSGGPAGRICCFKECLARLFIKVTGL